MEKSSDHNPTIIIREISDADDPPKICPKCGSPNFSRFTYHFRELFELGDINTLRKVKYENITWKCADCQVCFNINNNNIPPNIHYMPSVVNYVKHRVIKKGDSGRRVAEDLNTLHNVSISPVTVNKWVNGKVKEEKIPIEFDESLEMEKFSGIMTIDGTFKSVKQKKNDQKRKGEEPYSLHLTRLKDGRLAAYWHPEKQRKK